MHMIESATTSCSISFVEKYTPLYYSSTEAMVLQSETVYWMGFHVLKVFRYAEWYPTGLVVEPGAV